MIIPSSEVHFGTLSTEKHYEMSQKKLEKMKKKSFNYYTIIQIK